MAANFAITYFKNWVLSCFFNDLAIDSTIDIVTFFSNRQLNLWRIQQILQKHWALLITFSSLWHDLKHR